MEERCTALKLLLDQLHIPSKIESVGDRKRVQKSIYLLQVAGLDLGYRFGWYLMGPYSPSLTRDYYDLAGALQEGEDDFQQVELRPSVLKSAEKVKPLLEVPGNVQLDQPGWLELVASLHYLQKVNHLPSGAADSALKEAKPALYPWVHTARHQLEACGLLP